MFEVSARQLFCDVDNIVAIRCDQLGKLCKKIIHVVLKSCIRKIADRCHILHECFKKQARKAALCKRINIFKVSDGEIRTMSVMLSITQLLRFIFTASIFILDVEVYLQIQKNEKYSQGCSTIAKRKYQGEYHQQINILIYQHNDISSSNLYHFCAARFQTSENNCLFVPLENYCNCYDNADIIANNMMYVCHWSKTLFKQQ